MTAGGRARGLRTLVVVAALLSSGWPTRADEPDELPAAVRARVEEAESLEAQSRERLSAEDLPGAEAAALRALEIKLAALGAEHPRLASAYVAAADAALARVAGPEGDRLTRAARVPRRHEATVSNLYRRALERLGPAQARERAALLVVVARTEASFGKVAPAARGVIEALGLLGDADDPEAAWLRRAALETLFLDPWHAVRDQFPLAFAGLTPAIWDLEPQARRNLAHAERESGAGSAQVRQALQCLYLTMLSRPERATALRETAERAGAVSRGLPQGAADPRQIPQAFLEALAFADDGDVERAPPPGQPQGASLEQDHVAGPARKYVADIRADLPALEAAVRKHGPVSAEAAAALERHLTVVALERPSSEWGQLPRSYVLRRARELQALRERVHGERSAEVADGLVFRATVEYVCGLHEQALASAEEGAALRARVAKKSRAAQADAHAAAGYVACALEKAAQAAAHYQAARDLRCEGGVPGDPEGFRVCLNLAAVEAARGRAVRAQEILDAALPAFFSVPAVRQPFVDQERWRFAGAENLLLELGRGDDLERLHALLKPPASSWDRNMSAVVARIRGDYREVVRSERAFVAAMDALTEQQSKSRYPDWALRRLEQARGLLELGAEDEALADVAEALESFDAGPRVNFWPPLHDDRAGVLLGLVALAETLGRRGLEDQAQAIAERAYAMHADYAAAISQRVPPGLAARLERLFVHPVLERRGATLPPLESHAPEVYATALLEAGEPARAAAVLRGELSSLARRVPAGHPRLGRAHGALARFELRAGAGADALEHAQAALASLERELGPDHPEVAAILVTLGDARLLAGSAADALAAYRRALDIGRESLAATHPILLQAQSGSALALTAVGEPAKALEPMRQALDLVARRIEAQFVGATTKDRVQMQAAVQWILANWMKVCTAAGVDGYEDVLRLKARAGASMAEEARLARSAQGQAQGAARRVEAARRRLARLAHEAPRPGWRRLPWRSELAAAARELSDASRDLARLLPTRARVSREARLRVAEVAGRLEPHEALIDTLLAGGRYAAWVVSPGAAPSRLDLGPEAELTEALQRFRDTTRAAPDRNDAAWKEASLELRRLLWEPLAGRLPEGVRTLYLVPDGPLAAAPLEALSVEGAYLMDRYRFVRLIAAHDLLPRAQPPRRVSGALLVGAVDFDGVPGERAQGPVVTGETKLLERVEGLKRFDPLPGTAVEVRRLEEHLRRARPAEDVVALEGLEASESRVRAASTGRRIVHLATHGFVRDGLDTRLRVPADEVFRLGPGLEEHARRFDPLLASGLVLAGVNSRVREGEDDGVLTALEVLSFDLEGTELAFLSACDTARGIAQAGEGVHGLVRAMVLAGAEHVVASHWPVEDEPTGELVRRFYDAYSAGTGVVPADALRIAARALREETAHSAPRHWAAFSAYGPLR